MNTFRINEGQPGSRTVNADHFETVGDFVDFFEDPGHTSAVVLRVRAGSIFTIERVN